MNEDAFGTGLRQFFRYVVVGAVSNAALFIAYLVLTRLGMGHKLAASVAYAIGVIQTFAFNRSWSFRDRGLVGPAFLRYMASYAFGYLLNMAALVLLVDYRSMRHEYVQAATILGLAVVLFLLQKFWVFRDGEEKHR